MGERPERLSAAELAARSAVPVQTVNDLARAGVLRPARDTERPYSPADVMRVELALATERTGIPPAELGAAIAAGELSLGYLDALPPPPPVLAETVGEVASRLGLPFEELNRTIASFGLPVPAADDPARVDDAYVYEVIEAFIGAGLEGEALYAVCRIYSEAIRHLAQYQVDLFHTRFEQPYREEGLTEGALLDRAVADVASVTSEMGPRVVEWLYRRHSETFAIQHRLEHAEAALEEAGLHRRRLGQPPGIVFLDLSGFTALTEERGDEASADVALRLAAVTDTPVREHRGHVVKWLGDGVELYFDDPCDAVACALVLVDDVVAAGLPPAHVGINAGWVVYRGGDYYGRTVNIAARIAGTARAHQVLAGEEVRRRCEGDRWRFTAAGSFELKGVAGPVPLYQVEAV